MCCSLTRAHFKDKLCNKQVKNRANRQGNWRLAKTKDIFHFKESIMKKRILSLILCVLMVLSVFPFSVLANENNSDATVENSSSQETKVENALWEYEPYGDGIALTKYLGTQEADIYVPNKLGEYKVIKLAESIFENNSGI